MELSLVRIIVLSIVIITIVYLIYNFIVQYKTADNNAPWLIYGSKTASNSSTIVPSNKIPLSEDGKYGIEFSYSFWMLINKITDKPQHVFHKGDPSGTPLQAPGVFINANTNELLINMNTFAHVKESCNIGNIPIGKWVHISIVLMNKYIDVYVNGNLKKRCQLKGLPKQNFGDLYITSLGNGGGTGFNGYISRFRYYAYALPYYKIRNMIKSGPSREPCIDTGEATPPYLADDYWTTTGFPKYDGMSSEANETDKSISLDKKE